MTDRLTDTERRFVEGSRHANSAATWLTIIDRLAPKTEEDGRLMIHRDLNAQAEDIREIRRRIDAIDHRLANVDNSLLRLAE